MFQRARLQSTMVKAGQSANSTLLIRPKTKAMKGVIWVKGGFGYRNGLGLIRVSIAESWEAQGSVGTVSRSSQLKTGERRSNAYPTTSDMPVAPTKTPKKRINGQ